MKDLMQLPDFLVIDLETTGLDSNAEICEIAIINKRGDTLLHALVRFMRGISAEATKVHGITEERVASAAPMGKYVEVLEAIFRHDTPKLAYNAEFECRILKQNTPLWMDLFFKGWHCAMLAYAEHYGEWNDHFGNYKYQKLTTACKEFGIPLDNAHSALDDARATLEVVKALAALEEDALETR